MRVMLFFSTFPFNTLKYHCCSSSNPQEWSQFSQYNVARAQEAMHVSQQMREDMSLTRVQVCMILPLFIFVMEIL